MMNISNPQLSLFDVEAEYAKSDGAISNQELYARLASKVGLTSDELRSTREYGDTGATANPFKHRIRWHQQSLKAKGIIEHGGEKGYWKMTKSAKTELTENLGRVSLVAFSTTLGVCIYGLCRPVFRDLDMPITLCVTSPPYPIRRGRAYDTQRTEAQYIDFICESLEPIVENLRAGGNICLNIGNDCFEPRSPARSLYRERLVLALHERLGLHKMDELIWHKTNAPPGPVQYASLTRQQLSATWEPIYWFTNDPMQCTADNRRVLQPHTDRHKDFLVSDQRPIGTYSDGAHRKRAGSYRNITDGKIPRNVLQFPVTCASQRQYKRKARAAGLPAHGAPMPLALAKFLVEWLSDKGDLVVEPFSGSGTTALAAEQLGRPWVATEAMLEYAVGSGLRFSEIDSFKSCL